MAGHTVGGGGIETVAGKEGPGGILGYDSPVKEHGAAVGVFGAEFNVMAHHDNRHAAAQKALEYGGQRLFELGVQTLCGLVHEQYPGLQK